MEKWKIVEEKEGMKSLYLYDGKTFMKVLEGMKEIYKHGLPKGESNFLIVEEPDSTCSLYLWDGVELKKMLEKKKWIVCGGLIKRKDNNFLVVREPDGTESLYLWSGKEFIRKLVGKRIIWGGLVTGRSSFLIAEEQDRTESLYYWNREELLKLLSGASNIFVSENNIVIDERKDDSNKFLYVFYYYWVEYERLVEVFKIEFDSKGRVSKTEKGNLKVNEIELETQGFIASDSDSDYVIVQIKNKSKLVSFACLFLRNRFNPVIFSISSSKELKNLGKKRNKKM